MTHPLSILITDDDQRLRETLRRVIEPHGFRTLEAADGQQAVDIVQRDPVHLLLMDVHMPRLTGLEALRRVRLFNDRLPCILMSAETDSSMMEEARVVRAFSVLTKPITRQLVLDNVRAALAGTYPWYRDE